MATGAVGERRRLVFSNLLNGVSIEQLMATFKLSAKEVMDDFDFVARKIRSYRFERGQPFLLCDTIANASGAREALLFTLTRINTDTDPKFSHIQTLPFEPTMGSAAVQKMQEIATTRRT